MPWKHTLPCNLLQTSIHMESTAILGVCTLLHAQQHTLLTSRCLLQHVPLAAAKLLRSPSSPGHSESRSNEQSSPSPRLRKSLSESTNAFGYSRMQREEDSEDGRSVGGASRGAASSSGIITPASTGTSPLAQQQWQQAPGRQESFSDASPSPSAGEAHMTAYIVRTEVLPWGRHLGAGVLLLSDVARHVHNACICHDACYLAAC